MKGGKKISLVIGLVCFSTIILAIFLLSKNKGASWLAILPILICVGSHFFMHSSAEKPDDKSDNNSSHHGGSCCGGKKEH